MESVILEAQPEPAAVSSMKVESLSLTKAVLPSIIVVSYNTRELTLACLRSLRAYEPSAEIIVVDNASEDGSADAIAAEFRDVKLLRLTHNIGFARANIVGMEASTHDVIILFNSDAEVHSDALSRCISHLIANAELGAVTPRLRGVDGNEQTVRHHVPTLKAHLQRALWQRRNLDSQVDYYIPGTCMVLKRTAIEQAGGLFDPQLFMYWEDADLCTRLKATGYQLDVVDEAEVLHHGGASGGGPNCTAKAGLHEWYTFGRHVWFSKHRPAWEVVCLWLLEFFDAFRCLIRSVVRKHRRHEWEYGKTLLKTLLLRLVSGHPSFGIADTHGRHDDELVIDQPAVHRSSMPYLGAIGAVVIGRNEGERLVRCLSSLTRKVPVVYVDSGSSDGSLKHARSLGVTTVELDLAQPFTAARARNVGMKKLLDVYPYLQYIQFVDGDCEIEESWLTAAYAEIEKDPHYAIICGKLRERHPEQSCYNRLCQIEWRRPAGRVDSCGGIFLGRVAALQQVGGFDESLIAGEEPELCFRLRQAGWSIHSIPALMAQHDAAMTQFKQWWKRTVRAGHSYAEAYALHGASTDKFRLREVRSILLWGALLPVIATLGAWPTTGLSLVVAVAFYIRLFCKVYRDKRRQRERRKDALVYAWFVVLGKFPQAWGVFRYHWNRIRQKRCTLIEYK